MCGAAGLFIGCATEPSSCPLSVLKLSQGSKRVTLEKDNSKTNFTYSSAFSRWDTKSSVRSSPDRVESSSLQDATLFPDELVPMLSHEYFWNAGHGLREKVRLSHLERYLKFTLALETDAVNPVILNIARARDRLVLPPEMRQDAFRMYVDEAYHANFTYSLLRLLERERGISAIVVEVPYFLQRLAKIADATPADLRHHLISIFVSISELLITGTLNSVPKHESVADSIRLSINDHAADEARHHAFFAVYLPHYWDSLTYSEQQILAPRVPDLIDCFLKPDIPSQHLELISYEIPEKTIRSILDMTFNSEKFSHDKKRSARPVTKLLEKMGLCDSPVVNQRLVDLGLV